MPGAAINGAIAAANRRAAQESQRIYKEAQQRQQKVRGEARILENRAARADQYTRAPEQKPSAHRVLLQQHGADAAGCLRRHEQMCSLLADHFSDAPLDDGALRAVLSAGGVHGEEAIQVSVENLETVLAAYEDFVEERERLDALFALLDGNSSGLIERAELIRFLADLGASAGVPNIGEDADSDVHVQHVLETCGCGKLGAVPRDSLQQLLDAAEGWTRGLRAAVDAETATSLDEMTEAPTLHASCTRGSKACNIL